MLALFKSAVVATVLTGSVLGASATTESVTTSPVAAASSSCANYGVLLARTDGSVSVDAPNSNPCAAVLAQGSLAGVHLNKPIIGVTALPSGKGYWLLASDGGVFSFGKAAFYGSTGSLRLNQPVVGMAATPSGRGYWLVASDGGIFAFGDAHFYGSTGSLRLNRPVVGMAADQATGGYWLVAADGGIFAFNAPFLGSLGSIRLNAPVRFVTGTPDYGGYRLVASDGGVFNFGDAKFYGSAAAPGSSGWSALATTTDGDGYWLFGSAGNFDSFGDADSTLGHAGGDTSTAPVIGAATVTLFPSGDVLPSAARGDLSAVSCGTTQTCVAVGSTYGGGGALIETSNDGGGHFVTAPVPSASPPMSGVDCTSALHCVAVGTTSAMVSNDGGATWALVATSAQVLQSVSCESDSVCAAVGGGAGPEAYIYSTDGGLTWSTSAYPASISAGVACSPTACVAAGNTMSLSTDGGASWSARNVSGGSQGFVSASCTPGGSSCLGISPNGAGTFNPTLPGELAVSTDGGATWTNDSADLPASTATLQAVACGGSSDCLALGPPPSTAGSYPSGPVVGAFTTNGGTAWTPVSGPADLSFASPSYPPLGVTCSGASTCILVGANSTGPVADTTTNGGQSWTADNVQQS